MNKITKQLIIRSLDHERKHLKSLQKDEVAFQAQLHAVQLQIKYTEETIVALTATLSGESPKETSD